MLEINNDIRKKIKSIKYQYLKKLFNKYLTKLPQNCKYNKIVRLPNGVDIQFCSFNIEATDIVDLCYNKEHSQDCNAFCSKYTKEQLRDKFVEEIQDPTIRATKYKDLNIMYWLFPDIDKEITEIPKLETPISLGMRIKSLFKRIF